MSNRTAALAAATALLAAPAFATPATVATDLNLRAGPGPNFQIQAVMPAEAQVEIVGCLEDRQWCEVSFEGTTGYAYAPYLAIEQEGTLVTADVTTVQTVETVTYEDNGTPALIGGATVGAIAAGAIGGPAAIAGGVLLGSLAGATAEPEVQTVAYVQDNPIEPIFIQGEPIVGATIPAEVALVEIPDSEFAYLNLNGELVLVDPSTRAIVYIVR